MMFADRASRSSFKWAPETYAAWVCECARERRARLLFGVICHLNACALLLRLGCTSRLLLNLLLAIYSLPFQRILLTGLLDLCKSTPTRASSAAREQLFRFAHSASFGQLLPATSSKWSTESVRLLQVEPLMTEPTPMALPSASSAAAWRCCIAEQRLQFGGRRVDTEACTLPA